MYAARFFASRYFEARYWNGDDGAVQPDAPQQIETGYPWHLHRGRAGLSVKAASAGRDLVTVRARVEAIDEVVSPASVSIAVTGRRDNIIFMARVEQPATASIAVRLNAPDHVSGKGRSYWDDDDEVIEMLRLIAGR